MKNSANGLFKSKPTPEAKGDNTTRVAREIIDHEIAALAAKTNRLRQARLAKEASEPPAAAKPKKPARSRAKTSQAREKKSQPDGTS